MVIFSNELSTAICKAYGVMCELEQFAADKKAKVISMMDTNKLFVNFSDYSIYDWLLYDGLTDEKAEQFIEKIVSQFNEQFEEQRLKRIATLKAELNELEA